MNALVRRLAPVFLMAGAPWAGGACFATTNDVRVLQSDVQALRQDQARKDSAMLQALEELMVSLRRQNDSLRNISDRLTRTQGDVRGDLYTINQQLLQIQELTGQSQRRLQELRSSIEARQQEAAQAPPTPTTLRDTVRDTVPAGAPGPNQLFQSSLDQLRRGSPGSARRGFEELLRLYPTSDVAGEAQFYLGEALAAEGNVAAADTAYATVVSKYAQSPRAATALYKRALLLQQRGNIAQARTALNDLVRRYPRSDEAHPSSLLVRSRG